MEPIKAFSNVVIGQFVLTRIPIKVYVDGRYLKITSTDDVQDPLIGFGMDEDGQMHRFDYRKIQQLSVSGNIVTLDTYNKAMGAEGGEEPAEEEPAEEEPKKEESIQMTEISKDVLKAKLKANDLEMKALKDKKKELQALPIDDSVIREDEEEIEGRGWSDLQTFGDLQTRFKNIKSDKRWAKGKEGALKLGLALLPGWVGNSKDAFDFLKNAMSQDDAKKDDGFIGQLDIDDEIQDIVDDTIEDNFLKYIENFIMSQPANKELGDDFSMNKKFQDYLDKTHNKKRKVQRPIGVEESIQEYTFGTGDIVKNINPDCEHFGSIGIVKKIIDLPNGMGKAAVYTVGNSGPTYKPGMGLTKTLDQLEKYNG